MTDLSEEEKQYLIVESAKAVTTLSKMHGIDYTSLPQTIRNLMIDVFIAGAALVITTLKKEETPNE